MKNIIISTLHSGPDFSLSWKAWALDSKILGSSNKSFMAMCINLKIPAISIRLYKISCA